MLVQSRPDAFKAIIVKSVNNESHTGQISILIKQIDYRLFVVDCLSRMACQALQYCMWKYMCCISKYLWAEAYICGLKKYLCAKKNICGHKNIFVGIKIYLWT